VGRKPQLGLHREAAARLVRRGQGEAPALRRARPRRLGEPQRAARRALRERLPRARLRPVQDPPRRGERAPPHFRSAPPLAGAVQLHLQDPRLEGALQLYLGLAAPGGADRSLGPDHPRGFRRPGTGGGPLPAAGGRLHPLRAQPRPGRGAPRGWRALRGEGDGRPREARLRRGVFRAQGRGVVAPRPRAAEDLPPDLPPSWGVGDRRRVAADRGLQERRVAPVPGSPGGRRPVDLRRQREADLPAGGQLDADPAQLRRRPPRRVRVADPDLCRPGIQPLPGLGRRVPGNHDLLRPVRPPRPPCLAGNAVLLLGNRQLAARGPQGDRGDPPHRPFLHHPPADAGATSSRGPPMAARSAPESRLRPAIRSSR
jgi:hypothetical protein